MWFRMAFAGLAALLFGGLAVHAEDRAVAPISKLLPFADEFLGLPPEQRNRIDLVYTFRVDIPAGSVAEFWVMDEGRRVDLAVDETGRVDWRALGALLDDDPEVWTNVPKGKGKVNVAVEPVLPERAEMSAAELKAAVSQANAALKKQAGLLSFAAPKVKAVGFKLPDGATAEVVTTSGERKPLDVGDGTTVRITVKSLKKMERIVFSSVPERDWFDE